MTPAAKLQIWELTKDLVIIERCKASVKLDPLHPDYWPFVLMEVEQALKPRRRKAPKPKLDPEHMDRYIKAYHEYQRLNFPAWHKDGHTLDPRPVDTGTANGLTAFITNYITWRGYRATRITTEGRSIEKDGKSIRIPTQTRKGTADVSSTIRGKSCMWEIKVGKDRPSSAQLKEQARERKAGGEYFFTHTAGEFFQQFDSIVVENILY